MFFYLSIRRILFFLTIQIFFAISIFPQPAEFALVGPGHKSAIVVDNGEHELIKISADLLASDIERITGYKPPVITKPDERFSPLLIIGTLGSSMIQQLKKQQLLDITKVENKWEVFAHVFIEYPAKGKQAMIIYGSDDRGTAYGVFHLSEIIGVSPWYWWADVIPDHKDMLTIPSENFTSAEPSVKYRGIFLNDEDWGLQPWAAKTFEKEVGDIGPKTYSKIFELLLRLKANTIWPAMHNCTRAFFHYPGNPEMARKYNIVIGSSHAEPMLRNNVDEWVIDSMGDFNYKTNRERVYKYWEQRAIQSKDIEAIYTMGMRGIHDSGMEGYKDSDSQKAALEQIFSDQRQILKKHINADVTLIPQAFVAYKEVLDIYDRGLRLDDDISMIWTDDNYGYLRRLNSKKEAKREGGSGIYYHLSYWGRPHDYLWLSTTHPMLIWEELTKAWQTNARKIWIVNVGDIKPAEYNIQLFLDMAYNKNEFASAGEVKKHFSNWNAKLFGSLSDKIAPALWEYYNLAFERRPEFMGWSQTEPNTPTKRTAYNHFFYGDEAQRRIDDYSKIENEIKQIKDNIPANRSDAFFQLVYYPVVCASYMNKKFLYADKAFYYGKLQNRLSAPDYSIASNQAYDSIVGETSRYNQRMNGKWMYMMSSAPRMLNVYQKPEMPLIPLKAEGVWNCMPEGYVKEDSCLFKVTPGQLELPAFTMSGRQQQFIDIFLTSETSIQWEAKPSDSWIKISDPGGELTPVFGKKEKRLWISVDWNKAPKQQDIKGKITIKAAGLDKTIGITTIRSVAAKNSRFVESDGVISIFAENYSRIKQSGSLYWEKIEGLGYSGNSLVVKPYNEDSVEPDSSKCSVLGYEFYTFTNAACPVTISCLPTLPVNSDTKLRLAVAIDNSPLTIVDFTTFGRSEEWKQNVLRNSAKKTVQFQSLAPGLHTLKIYAIDPGVIIDNILLNLGGVVKHYGLVEETKN
jgi:hypothetical protein